MMLLDTVGRVPNWKIERKIERRGILGGGREED